MSEYLSRQLETPTAQTMADLWVLHAQFDHLPRALREALQVAVRKTDVARFEDRRGAHMPTLDGAPTHRIADLLGAWDSRVADKGCPFPKPAATIYKMLDWLWPGTLIDTAGSAMIERETARVDTQPWSAETAPLARLLVGLDRWHALRRGDALVPGIDLVADLFLLQSLMHSVGGPLSWSLALAVESLDGAPAESAQASHQEVGPEKLLAALTTEVARTLKTLTSPDMPERLTTAMRTALPSDIPDSLIADIVAGAVLPRGTVFDRLGKSKRQGGREIATMSATGWLTSDSPKGPVRLAIPAEVMVRILDPQPSPPASAGQR
ncbi:hypothetical protein LY56_03505 [Roseinatronobacter thiooxidans]|uniref:Uncharacterized protein n=2 Tax=Roseinatronobacter thiooxidans TaxID=121821 RepID=A0A2W7PWG5_9RHOB|nr:hypothetical protein [Roseinatronobacter thiooxidans]PZX36247.1 hypothetical protein LY56_03505 [Roseinatronobacter thiooxidans]